MASSLCTRYMGNASACRGGKQRLLRALHEPYGPMARARRLPEDAVMLREGAALISKSVDTLRRWRRDEKLAFHYDGKKPSAWVSRAELLACAAAHAAPPVSTEQERLDAQLHASVVETGAHALVEE